MNKIGMRNIKTAISVVLCILITRIFHFDSPFYGCIAAVITMQNTIQSSFQVGKNRLKGTAIGAGVGIICSYIAIHNVILTGIGLILVIYIANSIKANKSTTISCIVFLGIMTNLKNMSPIYYGIYRFIETAIGIVIALIVNRYIFPYNAEEEEKEIAEEIIEEEIEESNITDKHKLEEDIDEKMDKIKEKIDEEIKDEDSKKDNKNI